MRMAFEGFGALVSRKRMQRIAELLSCSGFDADSKEWAGKAALKSVVLSIACFGGLLFVFSSVLKIFDVFTFTAVSVLCGVLAYFLFFELFILQLYYSVYGRAKKVEGILPDFLLLVANNIRSGLTPFAAFRQSARPEFGVLSDEIKVAAAKSLGTQSFEKALQQLSARFDSRLLRDTVSLFAQSLKSGSHLAKLLESSAMDLRKIQELRKEMVTSVRTYVLFVGFVALIATPLLLSISIQFLSILQGIQATGSSATAQFSFLSPKISITVGVMQNLALLLLVGNSLLAGVFLGVLNYGNVRHGLKYFPPLLVASLLAFFVFQAVVSRFFTSFLIPA